MPFVAYIFAAILGYLLGSIPTGYLVARAKGIDIRNVGSGNIGATNAMRVLGKPLGIFVLLVDALKGFVAPAFVLSFYHPLQKLSPEVFGASALPDPKLRWTLAIVAGIAVVLGHNYTCWLKFKGGKGIATTAGVYFALSPISVALALGVWLLIFLATRYVSIASIAAAIALPTAVWVTQTSLLLSIVTTALGVLAIVKHKSNIQRLMTGTEHRIHFGKGKSVT